MAAALLAGCTGDAPKQGNVGYIEGFLGGVMADEPRAALIGRDALSAGGSAADAAVAAYFTMAVTLPGAAGLGGGGVCIAYDPEHERADAFEFLLGKPAEGDARFAVPGNVRGMFALHAVYGVLNWSNLLLPAEQLARGGFPVSRAFVREVDTNAAFLKQHPETARAFGAADGKIAEATPLQQIPLSAMLSSIRVRGAGDFYQGASARQFVEAVGRAGGSLTLADMRDYLPRLQKPLEAPYGDETIYVSGGGGTIAGRVWAMLKHDSLYADAGGDGARAHLLAAASVRAYAAERASHDAAVSISPQTAAALIAGFDPKRRAVTGTSTGTGAAAAPAVQNGASVVAVDRYGEVVACGFTMGRPFGSGVVAPGTGILLAPADDGGTVSRPAALAIVNTKTGQTFLGAAIGGGSPVSLAALALDVRSRNVPLDAAVAAPRLYDPGRPDTVFHEATLGDAAQAHLKALGYALEPVDKLGRINAFYCPQGLPRTTGCVFDNDPRGFGLTTNADK